MFDPLDKVIDPLDDGAGVGWYLVEDPRAGDHPSVEVVYDGPVVVGLLLLSTTDGDDVAQIRPHTLQNLAPEVHLTLVKTVQRVLKRHTSK